jgi:hypothetical protein
LANRGRFQAFSNQGRSYRFLLWLSHINHMLFINSLFGYGSKPRYPPTIQNDD